MKKLGFGFMRLPVFNPDDMTTIDIEQTKHMADYFIANSFTYFDTAYMYHDYKSENALKQAVVERYSRDKFTVATKMPLALMKSGEDHARIFEEQKKNIGVEFFDYYLLHNMTLEKYETAKKWGTIEYLEGKRKSGEIKHLGFSCHDTAENLAKILDDHPGFEFVQLQINYLDWDNAGVQSGACYRVAEEHGLKVIVMEPVKGGMLVNIPEEAEKLLRAVHPDWEPAHWAVKFAASLTRVETVLSGMSTFAQLQSNVDAMKNFVPFTDEENEALMKVAEILRKWYPVACTSCRYCVETNRCPVNIAIPNYFALYNSIKQRESKGIQGGMRGFMIERLYYANLIKDGYGRAGDCVKCRSCEKVCPQHLKISELLVDVEDALVER